MADQAEVESIPAMNDDNGFEQVNRDDLSPSAPPAHVPHVGGGSGVEDLYSHGQSEAQGFVAPPMASQSSLPGHHTPASEPFTAVSSTKKTESVTSCCSCTAWLKNMDPRVLDLVYWRDVKKTGAVFGTAIILLLSLALFSVLSVIAYLSLVILTMTVSFRLYKNVMATVQKSDEGHPFIKFLDMDLSVSTEKVHRVADEFATSLVEAINHLRRLFFVEDMIQSLKFGLVLWILTYVGSWFNGMTLIIIAIIGVFTVPKFYETYKVQIDEQIHFARSKIETAWEQLKAKLPSMPGKKKEE